MTSPDYGKIIHRSWELTWKNKWLWVYGLVLAAMGGGLGSGSGGGSGSSDSGSSTKNLQDLQKNLPVDLPKEGEKVLGQATDMLSSWFLSVPVTTWIVLVLALIFIIIFAIVVSMVIRAWAAGSLISGLEMADKGEAVGLVETSKQGLKKFKSLIIYSLIVMGLSLGLVVTAVFVVGIGALVFSGNQGVMTFWLIVTGILAVITLIVAFILLAMTDIYAQRLIVLKEMAPWDAWKKGLSLSKGSFLPMVLMAIINSLIGCGAGCASLIVMGIVFGIPAVIVALPMFTDGFHLVWGSVVGLFLIIFAAIYANIAMRAVLMVFNYGNWNLFFKEAYEQTSS